jgi:hypothetical protein
MAKTIIAQRIVIASIPLAALNISNLLKIRKTKILGKTHKVIECVTIPDSFSRVRYEPSDISLDEKRKTIIPMTNGKINPLIRPVISLSYFSGIVIS